MGARLRHAAGLTDQLYGPHNAGPAGTHHPAGDRLSGQQYGFIISAFSVAYMLSNPLWGRILDRAGLRRGMTAAVACGDGSSDCSLQLGQPHIPALGRL